MKAYILPILVGLLALVLLAQGQPPGSTQPQITQYSRSLLTKPDMAQWQVGLGINPNGKLVAGSNITLVAGSGFTVISSGTNANGTNVLFTSTNAPLVAGQNIIAQAHNLGVTPSLVRAVMVNQTADISMVPTQEYDCAHASIEFTSGGQSFVFPAFGVWADATNVYVNEAKGNVGTIFINNNGNTGVGNPITLANWQVKVYARP